MAAEPLLSVILPAHNEAENIPKMARRLAEVLPAAHIRYEVLFVNDGSTDNSWDVIRQTAQAYPQVRGIRFSRAFGKEAALYAGLQAARGDCCVTLDCDLQHPVETIPAIAKCNAPRRWRKVRCAYPAGDSWPLQAAFRERCIAVSVYPPCRHGEEIGRAHV